MLTNSRVERLLTELGRAPTRSRTPLRTSSVKPETEHLRDGLYHAFQKWVIIYQQAAQPEKTFVNFISDLTKKGILAEDMSPLFFRVCAESSVSHYMKCMTAGEYSYAFHSLDATSRLIVYMIKYQGDQLGNNTGEAKVHYLTKILSIFVLVLANMHEEQGAVFQQKPFFRFFSSLLNDFHAIEGQLGSVYFNLLIAIRLVASLYVDSC